MGQLLSLADQGFEDGTTGTWSVQSNATVANTAAQAQAGTKSLQITSTAATDAVVQTGIYVDVLTPGEEIVVSGFVRSATHTLAAQTFILWYSAGGTTQLGSTNDSGAITSTSAWTPLAGGRFIVPPLVTSFSLWVQFVTPLASGEVHYLDGVSVVSPSRGLQGRADWPANLIGGRQVPWSDDTTATLWKSESNDASAAAWNHWFFDPVVGGGGAALAGSLTIQFGNAATLTTSIPLSGSTAITTTSLAALTTAIPLSGSLTIQTGDSGALTTSITLSGSAAIQTGNAAALTTSITLSGSTAIQTGDSASLTTAVQLAGSAAIQFGDSAALTTSIPLSGSTAITFGNTSSLGADSMVATAAIQFGATGSLTTAIPLSGSTAIQTGDSAALTTSIRMTGSTAITTTAGASTVNTAIPLSGSTAITFADTADLTAGAAPQMAGSSALNLTVSGNLTTTVRLAGNVSVSFGASGSMGVNDELLIDAYKGAVQSFRVTASTNVTFAHFEPHVKVVAIILSTGQSMSWDRVVWPAGPPTLTGADVILFTSPDAGSTIYGRVLQSQ